MIVLDTHALIWVDRGDAALGPTARESIERAWKTDRVAVNAISFWETAMLASRGRITLPIAVELWRADLLQAGIHEVCLDGRLSLMAAQLPDFHKDPADRFIVATAIHHRAVLITADQHILAWRGELSCQDARL
jgi:PIN domain nuclease of toxin-antitoxin system